MTRFALILAAILAIGGPVFGQQLQSSHQPQQLQPQAAQFPVRPLSKRLPQNLTQFRAEPIPSWNIHGYAEVIPNLPIFRVQQAENWKGFRPFSPPASSPQVERATATATPPQSVR
jgi:hypothetical protein